nr:DNA replication and repair protein RecF [Brucepastera parasyntrophica]
MSGREKKVEKNARTITDRKELVDTIPCVLFNHDDLDFVTGSPERKRFFIDQSLSMFNPSYIDLMRQYKKILKNRNMLLKKKQSMQKEDISLLDVFDIQLAESGAEVVKHREKTIWEFNQVFAVLYQEVSGISGVNIDYSPSWKENDTEKIMIHLSEKRKMDILMGTSMSGPHRDRIRFMQGKNNFVLTASTGQKRLLSLILRTAQALFYTKLTGRYPVLLMDDVLLELDMEKRQRFTAVLPEYDQLFCTFLPDEPYGMYKKTSTCIYTIQNGSWHEQ